MIEKASSEIESRLGPGHHDTVEAKNALADALRAAGRRADAVRLYESNLKASEAGLGPDARITMITAATSPPCTRTWADSPTPRPSSNPS